MNNRDPRRRFSKRQRDALFLAADGRSELSGDPLGDDWHADHIAPWSHGGATDVVNGQALTRTENVNKSDSTEIQLRSWQRRFVNHYQSSSLSDYLLAALPGGGKTIAALYVASTFIARDTRRRIICVAPTKNVQDQWRDEASRIFNMQFLTKDFKGSLQDGYDGIVTTYQAVASNADLFRRFCAMHGCLIILDEIHHASEKSTWGERIKYAFENALNRLCLSGTPFRSDGTFIPFMRVDPSGFYHVDFSYDYPGALSDGVVREVAFHRHGGSATGVIDDEAVEYHTDDKLNEDEAARRLRWLLRDPEGTYTKSMLLAAHERLIGVRRMKPDAGGLALCIDANHAVRVAGYLREITGEAPDIVVSDDELATGSVKGFRKSTKQWIVAVRMVSEGVDIKRLMVLAYLTNTATELFFRQAIGRIVRSEGTDFDTEAYCIIPADPRLVEFATKIEEFQAQVLEEDDDAERRERERVEAADRSIEVILGSSEAIYEGMIGRGTKYETDKSHQIVALSKKHGLPEIKIAALLEDLGIHSPAAPAPEPAPDVPLEEQIARLRRQISKLTNRLANARNVEPKDIHFEYMKIANVRQPNMTLGQLEEKRQWLMTKLSETK